jgi:hypothetical protein
MQSPSVFLRYTNTDRTQCVVGLTCTDGQYEVVLVVRFQPGRTTGEAVGLKDLSWSVRQALYDNYSIGL